MTLFPLEGNLAKFRLNSAEQDELSELPFTNKAIRVAAPRTAIILWGPPNSGKTSIAHFRFSALSQERKARMVCVNYDEPAGDANSGALFNIPFFAHAYAAIVSEIERVGYGNRQREAFLKIFREFRSDSQRIRSLTLNKAVERGYDVMIDITSSGPGTWAMVEKLRQGGIDQIHFWGALSPLHLAEKRSQRRYRPVEQGELYEKRIGALGTFPGLLQASDRFDLMWNGGDIGEVDLAFSKKEEGCFVDGFSCGLMRSWLTMDIKNFSTHKDLFVRSLAEKNKQATHGFLATLESLEKEGKLERGILTRPEPFRSMPSGAAHLPRLGG